MKRYPALARTYGRCPRQGSSHFPSGMHACSERPFSYFRCEKDDWRLERETTRRLSRLWSNMHLGRPPNETDDQARTLEAVCFDIHEPRQPPCVATLRTRARRESTPRIRYQAYRPGYSSSASLFSAV